MRAPAQRRPRTSASTSCRSTRRAGEGGTPSCASRSGCARPRRSRAISRARPASRRGDVGYAGPQGSRRRDARSGSRCRASTRMPRSRSSCPARACSRRGAIRTSCAPDQLRGNRFEIVARDVDAREPARRAARALRALAARGPAEPLRRAALRARAATTPSARSGCCAASGACAIGAHARFLISALQAAVFNAVLAARPLPLDALELGDVAMLHASGGLFVVEDLAREAPRAARLRDQRDRADLRHARDRADRRRRRCASARRSRRSASILAALQPPPGVRLRGARRALRVRPGRAGASPPTATAACCASRYLPAAMPASLRRGAGRAATPDRMTAGRASGLS